MPELVVQVDDAYRTLRIQRGGLHITAAPPIPVSRLELIAEKNISIVTHLPPEPSLFHVGSMATPKLYSRALSEAHQMQADYFSFVRHNDGLEVGLGPLPRHNDPYARLPFVVIDLAPFLVQMKFAFYRYD